MINDTIMIFVFLVCLIHHEECNTIHKNRFERLFKEADKEFNRTYKIDIEKLRKASSEAAKSADLKTKYQRDKIMNQYDNLFRDATKYFMYKP